MENNKIKISVVTVCYNAVDTIEETIKSVINQSYDNVEYIIIDGGSTDGTADIIKKYSDQIAYWVSEPDNGIYDAMNKGILLATGDYINLMNSGDSFADENVIASFVKIIPSEADIIIGNTIYKFKNSSLLRVPGDLNKLKEKQPFCHQSALISRMYQLNHLYDTSFKITADYNFFYNSYYKWKAIYQFIPLTIAVYNCAKGISTDNLKDSLKENFRIWGIENNTFSKIPWYLKLLYAQVSNLMKKILPSSTVVNMKKMLDKI